MPYGPRYVSERYFFAKALLLGVSSRWPACRNRRRCTAGPFVSSGRPTSWPVGDAAAAPRGAVGVSGSGRLATVSRDNPISRCSGRQRGRPSSRAACCRNVGRRLGYSLRGDVTCLALGGRRAAAADLLAAAMTQFVSHIPVDIAASARPFRPHHHGGDLREPSNHSSGREGHQPSHPAQPSRKVTPRLLRPALRIQSVTARRRRAYQGH